MKDLTIKPEPTPVYNLTIPAGRFQAIVETRKEIVEFIRTQLFPNVDFGLMPGTQNKVLFKPGMQKINALMGVIAHTEVTIQELGGGHREYLVKTRLKQILPDGSEITVAMGDGSCSTMESKYKYRTGKRSCPKCGFEGIRRGRNGHWCPANDGGCGQNFTANDPEIKDQQVGKVENPDIADVYNTVLKMAVKRSGMDATLNLSGGWSEHFAQMDLDEAAALARMGMDTDNGPQAPAMTVAEIREEYKTWPEWKRKKMEGFRKEFKREGCSDDDATMLAYEKTLRS